MDNDRIVIGRRLPKISNVALIEDRRVLIEWDRGDRIEREEVDLSPALWNHRAFVPLRADDALFAKMEVVNYGSALGWPGEIELSAEWIDRLPRLVMGNDEFRDIMDKLGMTLDGMAATLGMGRRMIAHFRKDAPIPPAVVLASRALAADADQRSEREKAIA